MTPEVLEESIEKAISLTESLRALDQRDENDIVIDLTREEWEEAKALSAELKETLKYIPASLCVENGLPYHPTDEKYEYPRTPFPEKPDYPLGENNPEPSGDVPRVGHEYRSVA